MVITGSGEQSLVVINPGSSHPGLGNNNQHGLYVHKDIGDARVSIDSATASDAVLRFLNGGTLSHFIYSDGSDTGDPLRFYDNGQSKIVLSLDRGNAIFSGNVSGSATSTGSFGAVELGGIGHVGHLRLQDGANYHELKEDGGSLVVMDDNRNVHFEVTNGGDILPGSDNSFDLGSASKRWANLFVGDLELSNEGSGGNDVDGTEGKWTIQEGEENLYLLNRKNNKKYKFLLEEIE